MRCAACQALAAPHTTAHVYDFKLTNEISLYTRDCILKAHKLVFWSLKLNSSYLTLKSFTWLLTLQRKQPKCRLQQLKKTATVCAASKTKAKTKM